MVLKKKFFPILLFGLLPWGMLRADEKEDIAGKLLEELHQTSEAKDSIKILYDLYDVSSRRTQMQYGWQLLHTAMRSGDYETEMAMLMQLSILYANTDSVLSYLANAAKKLPPSDEKKECEVFLQLQIIGLHAKQSAQQQQQATDFINRLEVKDNDDIFCKILKINTLCIYLSYTSNGILYTEYMEQLESLIKQLPPRLYALRNLFYTRSAIVYTANDNYAKAIRADKELLHIIRNLERKYGEMGRIYRNYDVNYYLCYRRILSNYPGLTRQEIEDYYHKAMAICKRNMDTRNDAEQTPRIHAFYLFATRHYKEAIPYIQKCLDSDLTPANRRKMLQMLRDAAGITGNDALLLEALKEYNVLLEDHLNKKSDEFFRELQIRYDVESLKSRNASLEVQKQQNELLNNRRIVGIALPALAIVLVLLIVAVILYYRSRKLASHLQHSSDTLIRERDMLNQAQTELVIAYKRAEEANRAKSEFLHSMSHEVRTPLNSILGFSQLIVKKIPEELQGQLGNFANLVKINTDYLVTLINDILDIASIESNEMAFPQTQDVSIHTLCKNAISEVSERVKEGVDLRFDTSNPDIEITTDRAHVEQVLVNLLSNAAKFTKQGSITLNYYFKGLNKLVFEVSDTGIGIPEGKEEVIFDRFVKLDSFSQGSGLGLYLSKQLALRLGGELYVDPNYREGARFCFTIPVSPKN